MAADDVGPMERACICAGWRSLDSAHWDAPEVFAPAGLAPVLMVPEEWVRKGQREEAFAVGITRHYLNLYGWLLLVRGVVLMEERVTPWQLVQSGAEDCAAD
jgi:hypothetical protein